MQDQGFSSLNSSILQIADLFRIEFFPFFPMKFVVEFLYEARVYEIDERVPYVALILYVDRKVEEVVVVGMVGVYFFEE